MMGIPLESKDVTKEVLLDLFPTEDVLQAWARGEEAEWPPMEDYDDDQEFELSPFSSSKKKPGDDYISLSSFTTVIAFEEKDERVQNIKELLYFFCK